MINSIIGLLIFVSISFSWNTKEVQIVLVEEKYNSPISNVFYSNKKCDCIRQSNEYGQLKIQLPKNNDTLYFEFRGYEILKLTSKDLIDVDTIEMKRIGKRGPTNASEVMNQMHKMSEFHRDSRCSFGIFHTYKWQPLVRGIYKKEYERILKHFISIQNEIKSKCHVPSNELYVLKISINRVFEIEDIKYSVHDRSNTVDIKFKNLSQDIIQSNKSLFKNLDFYFENETWEFAHIYFFIGNYR